MAIKKHQALRCELPNQFNTHNYLPDSTKS